MGALSAELQNLKRRLWKAQHEPVPVVEEKPKPAVVTLDDAREFYVVVADFKDKGIHSPGDATTVRDEAYDDFAESLDASDKARAFLLTFDVETGALETCSEVTSDFQDEYDARCERWAAE
jgi:hypothetical protein